MTGIMQLLQLAIAMAGLLSYNASAQLLEDDALQSAEVQKLSQEIDMLNTIQRGIKLSVAECELSETCSTIVSRAELDQIISMLDARVDSLSLRYSETTDTALEGVLVAYADMRDGYKQILDKIAAMPQFATQEAAAADGLETDEFFTAGAAGSGSVSAELMQLFSDADDELVDDITDDSEQPDTEQ